MINAEIINERLREMEENLVLLEELSATPLDTFRSDPKLFKLAMYCVQISIQCLLDICHHIIVGNDWPRPKDNAEAILTLGEKEVIPLEFARSVVGMANLRNILVHSYLKIDRTLLYEKIQDISDFGKFQKHILTYISRIS
jgi:uncharacterized protein YutE (UPF0331/DUF86 family)